MMVARESCVAEIWKDLFTGQATLKEKISAIHEASGLSVVSLNIEPKCNLHCKHCFYAIDKLFDEPLSHEEWKTIIKQFMELGVRHFHICGREPFAGDIIQDVMKYLISCKKKEKSLHYGIITNGVSLFRLWSQIETWQLGYLDFSIDGLENDNDFLRGSGSFTKTLASLKQAIHKQVADTIYVSTVVHKNNVGGLSKFILKLHNEVGVNNFFLQPLQYFGRAISLRDILVEARTYGKLISWLTDLMRKQLLAETNIVFYIPQIFLPQMYDQVKEVHESLGQYFEKGDFKICINTSSFAIRYHLTCLAFWRQCQITADGYYVGCCSVLASKDYRKYAVGKVTDLPIKTLYNLSLSKWIPKIYNYSGEVTCNSMECFKKCFGGCRISSHIRTSNWALPECMSIK
jgi:radical SAM protein with 4Fe4S-binding SPASM domain